MHDAVSNLGATPESHGEPEFELLLCCVSASSAEAKNRRIRELLRDPINWDHLLQTAIRHGLRPLLYRRLKATCPELVPQPQIEKMRAYASHIVARNLMLQAELFELLQAFAVENIPVLPHKGAVLAQAVYGNLSMREFTDIDIVVRRRDVARATGLLLARGYRNYDLTGSGRKSLSLELPSCEEAFVRDDALKTCVDLHWALAPHRLSPSLDAERLWHRLQPIAIGGTRALSFTDEDLLIILCVHGGKHRWERLAWLCDIAGLIGIHVHALDWQRMFADARSFGVERMFMLGLFLAQDLLGAALPDEVSRRVRADAKVASLAAKVNEELRRDAAQPATPWQKFSFVFTARERWRDAARLVYGYAFTPTPFERDTVTLPVKLTILYSIIRPARLSIKIGRRLLRRTSR